MTHQMERDDKWAGRCIGVMVACQACNTVVWASDTGMYFMWPGISGLFNTMGMPCRICSHRGNYNGYNALGSHYDHFSAYDSWSTMRALAEYEGWTWDIAGDNSWRSNDEIEEAHRGVRERAKPSMDLDTVDLAHDLGERDLTDPITGEMV